MVLSKGQSFVFCLCAVLVAASFAAEAQQPAKGPRIGFLVASSPSAFAARDQAFRQRIRELGWIEGKNMASEYRYADGNRDQLPVLAAELVRLDLDIIVTVGPADTRAANSTVCVALLGIAMLHTGAQAKQPKQITLTPIGHWSRRNRLLYRD